MDALRADGFQLGVDNYLQIARVWRSLPGNSSGAEILTHIAPLVIRSADEESLFWERKEAYVQLLGKGATALEEEIPDATHDTGGEKETAEKAPKGRFYILLSLLLGLLMAVGLSWWLVPSQRPVTDELNVNSLIVGCRDSLALNFDPTATAYCSDCCIYEIIGCRDSTALNFNPKATMDCDGCCRYPLRESLASLAKLDSFSVPPIPPVYDYPEPDPLTPINTTWLWLTRYKSWLSWLIPLLVLCLSMGWWLWQRDRRDYLARRTRSDEPPYLLPIKIRRDRQLEMDEQFFYLIDQLRGREVGERVRIDLPTTIKATIQKGGFPQLRFRPYTRPTNYLILIDKQAEYNHQSQLFEYIYQHFVRQEVHAERFFFDGDPRWCWNDRQPKGLSLEQLLQRYSQARLLIFADGYSFIDPINGELEPWVKLLQGWQQRALITPAATAQWNYREAKLSEHLQVLPAGIKGMLQLVNHFESLSTPSLREWKYELGADDKMVRIDESQVVSDLQEQLSPVLVRWIAACAIYPELHWDLTLEIGETLGAEDQSIPFSEVRQLARLPWFREGYMPQGVRSQLLESELLSVEEEQAVRTAIVDILLINAPSKTESYAYEEHQLHLAINQLLLNQFTADRRKWLKRYRELHDRGLREDMVSMGALDRQYNRRLDFRLPSQVVDRLFAGGRRILGRRPTLPLFFSFILGVGVWGLVQMLPEPCETLSPPSLEHKEIYCLASPEDLLRYYAQVSFEALALGRPDVIDDAVDSLRRSRGQQLDTTAFFNEFLEPVLGRIWDQAQAEYQRQNYPAAARHFALARRLLVQGKELAASDSPKSAVTAYHCLNWQGISYFFAQQQPVADSIANLLQNVDTPDSIIYPNLFTLLNYDYVDSTAFGRIRVRTKDSRYGFLDAATGRPTWSGEQAPYEHAFHFQRDSLSEDTLALVTTNREQCFVDLSEQNKQRCFSQLIRFQNRANGLYGYVNELGTIIIPAAYKTAGEFMEDGLALVQQPGENFGYVRLDGIHLLIHNNLVITSVFEGGPAIDENQPSSIAFAIDHPDCPGDMDGQLVITNVKGGEEPYLFKFNDQGFTDQRVYKNLGPGSNSLVVQDALGNAFAAEINIITERAISIDLGEDQEVEKGTEVTLKPSMNIPLNEVGSLLITNNEGLSCDSCWIKWDLIPEFSSNFTAKLVDKNGCTAEDIVRITVRQPRNVYIPNVFSPGGDGKNDWFTVFSNGDVQEVLSVHIFDRWGSMLFNRENFPPNVLSQGWDGTYKGKPLNNGVFVYVVKVLFKDGEKKTFEGDVHLLRQD